MTSHGTDNDHKAHAQERKARRVTAVVGSLSRQVAAEMGDKGDAYAFNVRRNTETWVWMLEGSGGPEMREEAWVKLYDSSGINESVTGVNPSVEVRAMVLDILRRDLRIDRQGRPPVEQIFDRLERWERSRL